MARYETYLHYAAAIKTEWEQLRDEGRDVRRFLPDVERIGKAEWTPEIEREALALGEEMAKEPVSADYPWEEPSELEAIRAARPAGGKAFTPAAADEKKILAAWQGRVAGCLLGKPVEGMRRETLYPLLKAGGNYPMTKYIRLADYTQAQRDALQMDPGRCWADTLTGVAPVDDDTNYTVVGLKVLEDYGHDFRPVNVLEAWTRYLPMCACCTAERVAYRNAALCLQPPETATYRNPYREWIGAQIRADFFGYICPGDPQTAAEYAWRDASISHVRSGIYGEMWVAAMLAAAAVTDDIGEILDAGLAQVPEKSRFARDVQAVRAWFAEGIPAQEAMLRIHERYDEHSGHGWCHTISNAMIVTMALLWGGGDFGKTVCTAVECGFDTDCNGATAGSVTGMRNGFVPEEWTAPFKDGLRTSLDGYPQVKLEEMAGITAGFVR